ncbi:hypothetical protein AB4Y64_01575 [Lysobacter sp. TAF61]|uniref:hypothetical protein n=1 Tax=Lysobacter sp. TAF61 TaxID=3233072 RepID=UPI003F9EB112
MDKLLRAVLDAHGDLEEWVALKKITAELSLGGPFWAARGWPDVYSNQTVMLDPHHQHIRFTPFTAAGQTSVLDVEPERVALTASDGGIIEERLLPRGSFPLPFDPMTTPWDAVQVAYFTSAAVWNYLTAPFVFARPGVSAREIDPWTEGKETWRRLAVTFPESNANHNPEQVFYFDDAFMQRRMDYSPDVTGNPPVAHYSDDHKTFDGFVFPTRRRVYLHDAKGVADQSFAPITMDVKSVVLERT